MFEDRADVAEADEAGGGRDEEYEINSMGGTSEDKITRDGRDNAATNKTISPAENHRE